ncbi:14-3-3 protein zeta-like [Vigna radiata var. radiata]|uniref:14-3-3 protein zeta-like n=1 Tax=Vigna radiata var. radiata TaxID=3916 RepID=A0A1S3VBR2_VIGRR|nr:14-3-3 protein zeta-like [Vigna radiata var. radiata]
MKGDYYRYLVEFKAGNKSMEVTEHSLKANHTAATTVERELQPTHSIRLGDYYDIVGRSSDNYFFFFADEVTCQEHPNTGRGAMMNGLRESFRIIDTLSTRNDYIASVEDLRCRRLEVNKIQEEWKTLEEDLPPPKPPELEGAT